MRSTLLYCTVLTPLLNLPQSVLLCRDVYQSRTAALSEAPHRAVYLACLEREAYLARISSSKETAKRVDMAILGILLKYFLQPPSGP